MWLEIQRASDDESDFQGVFVSASSPGDSPRDDGLVGQDESLEGADSVDNSISLSPGLLLGVFALTVGCVVLAGAGLWLAGQFGGVGPLAAVPTLRQGSGRASVAAVAVVNGEPITTKQLDDLVAINVAMAPLETGRPVNATPEQWQQLRSQLLNQVIQNTLVLQAARNANITVSENQVEGEWLGVMRKYELSPGQLDAQLIQAGANPEVLREWLRHALVANLYLSQYVYQGAPPEEREEIYQQWIETQLANAQIQIYQTPAN